MRYCFPFGFFVVLAFVLVSVYMHNKCWVIRKYFQPELKFTLTNLFKPLDLKKTNKHSFLKMVSKTVFENYMVYALCFLENIR